MPNFFINVKSKGAKKASGEIRGLTGNLNGMASAAKKAAIIFGVGFLGKQIFDIGKSAIATAAQFETLRVRLTSMYGSVQRGEQAFKKFNDVAATTPFMLKDVVDAGATLKAFGLDAEAMIKPVSDLAAFMQVDISVAASNMGRAFVAGAGAADMFRDKGILPLIAATAGVADVTKLSLEEFREAMFKTLADPSTGIMGMTTKMADTWDGAVSNFQDGTDRLKAAIGDELIAILRPKLDAINVELSRMGEIGWDIVGQTFIDNSGIFVDMGAGIMGMGGKIIGLSFVDGFGNIIETVLPRKVDAVTFGLRGILGFLSDDVAEAMANINPALDEAFLTFDDHDEAITQLFEDMQILMTEGYAEFIRLAEEQKIAIGGSTEAIDEETEALNKNKDGVVGNISAFKKFNKFKAEMAKEDTFRIAMQSKDAESGMKAVVKAETMEAIAGLIASILKTVPYPFNLILAAGAGGMASAAIDRSLGSVKLAATGMNEIVTRPTMILAGEAGAESVNITPLSAGAGDVGGGGGTINVSVTGNVLTQDFVEGELAENIKEAIRRGTDFGIS